MSTSLLLACGLNEQKLPPYVHISEETNVDGSFLISSIIGQRLRTTNSGTLLICLQHNYTHYANSGMRLGYNLNMSRGKSLSVIDVQTDIAKDFINSKWTNIQDNQITENLYKDILNEITSTLGNKSPLTVIIDNLGILLNLGATKDDLVKFAQKLSILAQDNERITIIAKFNNADVYDITDNCLQDLSDLHIRVIKLKSGNFKEVDGRISVVKTTLNGFYGLSRSCKDILYKVNERNIKIFNPGEIGVKV